MILSTIWTIIISYSFREVTLKPHTNYNNIGIADWMYSPPQKKSPSNPKNLKFSFIFCTATVTYSPSNHSPHYKNIGLFLSLILRKYIQNILDICFICTLYNILVLSLSWEQLKCLFFFFHKAVKTLVLKFCARKSGKLLQKIT